MFDKQAFRRKAVRILMDKCGLSRQLANDTVAGFDWDEIIDDEMTPEEAVNEEMSYWVD
jgi:hypothetical protein